MKRTLLILVLVMLFVPCILAQKGNIWEVLHQKDGGPPAVSPLPTDLQLKYQRMEKQMFIHFSVNTYTGKGWGDGAEDPDIFNPIGLDCEQWVKLAKGNGYNTICLTVKHHDGFCLWPSKYTEHSVKNSRWRDGKGDVVRDFTNACKKYGVNISFYLSPWDRHDKRYNTEEYNNYFINQLVELMTEYGPVRGFWFDGASGGKNALCRTPYAWAEYYKVIRKYAPDAFIQMMGPDIGGVGNENAVSPKVNWNFVSVPLATLSGSKPGKIPVAYCGHTYTKEDEESVKEGSEGNYKAIEVLQYRPKEANTSILNGWFWNPGSKARSPQEVRDIYFTSVGGGCTMMLGLAPNRNGLIPQDQVDAVRQLNTELKIIFASNFAGKKKVTADKTWKSDKRFAASKITDGDPNTYWAGEYQNFTGALEVDLGRGKTVNLFELQEPVYMGQRISKFKVEYLSRNNKWEVIYEGFTIGYKCLIRFPAITAQKFRLVIEDALTTPLISEFGLYFNPFDEHANLKDYDPKKTKTGTKEEEAL